MRPSTRDEVVRLLRGRDAATEKDLASQPTRKAYRVRPDVTVDERQAIRTALLDRKPSELRLSGRHTRNAIKIATNPLEKAALQVGLTTLGEAYDISMAGAQRNAILGRIRLDDVIRGMADNAKEVRMLAAKLATELPKLRERVASGAQERNSSEDMVAIDGALALKTLRKQNKTADNTATMLETAIRQIEQSQTDARILGAKNGGYTKEQRLTGFATECWPRCAAGIWPSCRPSTYGLPG